MKRAAYALVMLAMIGGLLWWGWQEHQNVHRLRAEAGKVEAADRGLRTEVAELRAKVTALQKEKSEPLKLRPGPNLVLGGVQSVDLTSYMEADPDYPAYWGRVMQERVRTTYGDLKQFNLSPEKEAQLRKALANRLAAPGDVQAAISKLGYTPGSPEMYRAYAEAQQATERESDAEIQDILGKSGMASLQAAQRDLQNQTNVQAGLGTQLALAGMPLTAAQLKAVTDVFSPFSGAAAVGIALPADQELALRDHVAQVLTPQQLEVFLQIRDLMQQSMELQKRAKEAAKKNLGQDINSWSVRGP